MNLVRYDELLQGHHDNQVMHLISWCWRNNWKANKSVAKCFLFFTVCPDFLGQAHELQCWTILPRLDTRDKTGHSAKVVGVVASGPLMVPERPHVHLRILLLQHVHVHVWETAQQHVHVVPDAAVRRQGRKSEMQLTGPPLTRSIL